MTEFRAKTASSEEVRALAAANGWTEPFMHDRRGVYKFERNGIRLHATVSRFTGYLTSGHLIGIDGGLIDSGGPDQVQEWLEAAQTHPLPLPLKGPR